MINWNKTKERFGYFESDRIPKKQKIVIECDFCKAESLQTKHYHYRAVRRNGFYRCRSCSNKQVSKKTSAAIKKKWKDPEYRKKQKLRTHSDKLKEEAKIRANELWQNQDYINKYRNNFDPKVARRNLEKARKYSIEASRLYMRKKWQDSDYRSKMAQLSRNRWQDNNYRINIINKLKEHWSDKEVLKRASNTTKLLWQNKDYRNNWLKSFLESFTSERIEHISSQSAKNWTDDEYRNKIESNWIEDKKRWMSEVCKEWWSDNRRAEVSELMIERWSDPSWRKMIINSFKRSWTPERRKSASDMWTPEMRELASVRSKKLWMNNEYVEKLQSMLNKKSSIEIQMSNILDEYEVDYESQFFVGPWSFDFRVGDVLIEIQGDYWHSLPKTVSRDKAKATYIERYHQNYKLLYLWEHEFYQLDKIKLFVETNFGKPEMIPFEFCDVEFGSCERNEAKSLFEKYHYKGSLGRSGALYGAKLNNDLIAVCVFAHPTRNVEGGELTRFIIHPLYQKKNFASWFLSRATKDAIKKFGYLFTFADPNFNHNGTIYLASNWKYIGDTKSDYWYISKDGWIMHKKTLWNRAKNLCMAESEYSEKFGYIKVWGLPRKKYVTSENGLANVE